MDISNVLSLFGGLAMFLFGMNLMGEALERRAGNRLKTILSSLTSSWWKGFLLGLIVTSIIQSSSATTVMLVGFVNSGVMTLAQAIYVIMGANIGTTVTAWLLSMTGIQGDTLLLTLLKPASFTPVLAVVGVVMYMFLRNQKKKDTGMALLGFAVLMFGMEAMSGAVKPLSDVPEFGNALLLFSNPILGVLAGAVLTAIIQSSSASVGILQALCATGKVTFAAAVPIIMGQNIGTCVTAVISSVGANREAKRIAAVHLLFNILGTLVWLTLFEIARSLFVIPLIDRAATGAGIALVHTLFNVASTALLMPFARSLRKLACLLVRDKRGDDKVQMLDERLLNTPPVAIERSRVLAGAMADLSRKTLFDSFEMLDHYDDKIAQKILDGEDQVDVYEDVLGTYLVKLSGCSLSERDSHEVSELLHMIGDFERISDHAVNILESAQEMNDKRIAFSSEGKRELSVMIDAVREIVELAFSAFERDDISLASRVEPLEQVIDSLKLRIKDSHIRRLQRGECTIELGFVLSDLVTNLERVSDHCSNISACIAEISHASLGMHEYLEELKSGRETAPAFEKEYQAYMEKYALRKEQSA